MSPMPSSMFVRLGLLLTGAWIATTGMPASAQQAYRGGGSYGTFACQSDNGGYRECRIDTRQPVRLVRQTSRSQCIEGQTWGVRPGIVWVDRGCRAEFALEDRGHDWERPSGRSGSVVCESPRDRHNRCPMDTRYGVRIVRQLSETRCREGHNWGAENGVVWVDHGCRAEFAPAQGRYGNGHGNRYPRPDYGHGQGDYGHAGNDQVFSCASSDGRQNYCRVNIRRGVELQRQVSRSACVQGQSWGWDRGGVWVSNGCRGEFRAW